MDVKDLGFTEEELQQRVVDQICDRLLSSKRFNYDDEEEYVGESDFHKKLIALVKTRIDEAVEAMGEKHVLPNVSRYVEEICLQETTTWGEKKGEPMSFVEYLVQRADHYLREEVDHSGKTKKENSGYGWSKSGTRVASLIHKHLDFNIQKAMKEAVANVNHSLSAGLEETVKIKLAEISNGLKVTVKTR